MTQQPSSPIPNLERVRTVVRMAELAVRTAGHAACGLSRSQYELMLEQIEGLYEVAAWVAKHPLSVRSDATAHEAEYTELVDRARD